MGDVRYDHILDRIRASADVHREIEGLTDEEAIGALAAASRSRDPYWSNVLATEAENRALRTRRLLDVFGECVLRVDAAGKVLSLGGAAERHLGWSNAQARGRDAHALLHPSCDLGVRCPVALVARGRAETLGHDSSFARADGSWLAVGFRGFPIRRDAQTEGAALFFWPAEAERPDARPPVGGAAQGPAVQLTLYLAGNRADSERAAAGAQRLVARAGGAIQVRVVDVDLEPGRAESDRVVETPMLSRVTPEGERRVVGDLADPAGVVRALEIRLDPALLPEG